MSAGSTWGSIERRERAKRPIAVSGHQFAAERAAGRTARSAGVRDKQMPARSPLPRYDATQSHTQFGTDVMDVLIAVDAA